MVSGTRLGPHSRQLGEGLVRGIILLSRDLVGRMPHRRDSENDVSSGSMPRCLTNLHNLGQSVSGPASLHFRGLSGQSSGLLRSSFRGSCIWVLSVSDISLSNAPLREIHSKLGIEF